MPLLPRVAVGTIQPGADLRPALWALLEALRQQDLHVQSFLSRACFTGYVEEAAITGTRPRHLDSWLMSLAECRRAFVVGAASCDVAVVEGLFAAADSQPRGGRLDTLCQWLDLPRVVVLDVSQLQACRWPARPELVDGLLLDRVRDETELARVSTDIEALWGIPVLGAMEDLPGLRRAIAALPEGIRPPRSICHELGRSFFRHGHPQRVLKLAAERELEWSETWHSAACRFPSDVTVALAYDDAFHRYFPDALDGLESCGATIVDFSPLRDDRLPPGVDVVYLGCGHPERYAASLARNDCMKLALRNHVRNGGRVYAEGGGLAYLCQGMQTAGEDLQPMTGIFPAIAHHRPSVSGPAPAEVTLDRSTWLGRQGTVLRGYCNSAWDLEVVGDLAGCVAPPQPRYDLVGVSRAVGSRLHVNFAAQPDLLPGFCCRRH
jgi:cobyrinic acid a,c-diamide synthase